MRSRFELENGQVMLYSSSYSYRQDRIEFSETDEKTESSSYYTLEKISDTTTKLTLDLYIKKGLIGPTLFRLFRKAKMEDSFRRSLGNLGRLVKTMPSFAMEQG
ncbi:MAG TPA: hypothetical protein VK563_04260 [Puia sp.]|nr:hypothetical protein [Puia sp.]